MDADPDHGARLGLVGLFVTGCLAALAGGVAASSASFAAAGAAAHVAAGAWVWLGILLSEGRKARAEADRLELERLTARSAEGRRSLFLGDPQPAQHTAAGDGERFRKLGVPALTLTLAGFEIGLGWLLLSTRPISNDVAQPTLVGAATLCGLAFVMLLLGRYGFALAARGLPSAAGGGRRASSSALALFGAGLALAAGHALEWSQANNLGYAFAIAEVVLGLEAIALLLLDVYRPRRAGEEPRPPYDSRLLGLLSAPSDLAKTISHAVDYQFGFAVSQTWVFRFLERRVAPLLLFATSSFWLLSVLVVVGPHEHAILWRAGTRHSESLTPGLHLKLPWPLDVVEHVPTGRLHTLVTGGHLEDDDHDDDAGPSGHKEEVLLWTEGSHVKGQGETLVLLARAPATDEAPGDDARITPVNLLAASASVHYETEDAQSFISGVAAPHEVLELLAERELSFLLSGADLDELLRSRSGRATELQKRLQETATRLQLGVTIRSTSLADLHPPVPVGEAFEETTVALERSHTGVLNAEIYSAKLVPKSRIEAERIKLDARVQAYEQVVLSEADAIRFAGLIAIYRASPRLWQTARLLERLVAGAKDKRMVVLARPGTVLTELDLQEKISAESTGLGQSVLDPIDADEKESGE
jgi:modulator of FtsH protease HflK